jgi:hypothetical protein
MAPHCLVLVAAEAHGQGRMLQAQVRMPLVVVCVFFSIYLVAAEARCGSLQRLASTLATTVTLQVFVFLFIAARRLRGSWFVWCFSQLCNTSVAVLSARTSHPHAWRTSECTRSELSRYRVICSTLVCCACM